MQKIIKTGYVIQDAIDDKPELRYDVSKGMCPLDGDDSTSSRNKPYSPTDPYLQSIWSSLLANFLEQGMQAIGNHYSVNQDVFEDLLQNEEKILPDDIYDAIYRDENPRELDNGVIEYTNPATQTIVQIDTISNTIIAVYPHGKKDKEQFSKYLPYICGEKPIPDGTNLVVKFYGCVEKGSGSACGIPKLTTEQSIDRKLNEYLLNPDHTYCVSKAKWFEEALGFNKDNASELAKQIVFDPETATETQVTEFGTKYNQTIRIEGENGKSIDVIFAWIKNLDGVVRLITGIPTKNN